MNDTSSSNLDPSTNGMQDWRWPATLGYLLIVFTFVVLGGWAAFARLDSAVVAPGTVVTESNRKTVQHLEGGIIRDIRVREGQRVAEGEVLIRLDQTQPLAALDLQQSQMDAMLAREARLIAERDGAEIDFPQELLDRSAASSAASAMADQVKEFNERRASLSGQIDILQSRVLQFRREIDGLKAERTATQGQLDFILEELKDLRYLLDRNLVVKGRVLSLERERSRLEGVLGRSAADQAKAENGIGEAELQIKQLRQKVAEEVSGQILETRQKLAELREKVRVARDTLTRIEITAPTSGTVQGMKFFTAGGVVRPGEPMFDIAPADDQLIIHAQVAPQDIESLRVGMQAEIRFTAFKAAILPIILGEVTSVSRDRLIDEATKLPYFLALVSVADVPNELRHRLTAGMQAELVFPTGERTVLNYLTLPLKERLNTALREK